MNQWIQTGPWKMEDGKRAYQLKRKPAINELRKAKTRFKGEDNVKVQLERNNVKGYNVMIYQRMDG